MKTVSRRLKEYYWAYRDGVCPVCNTEGQMTRESHIGAGCPVFSCGKCKALVTSRSINREDCHEAGRSNVGME